MIRATNTIKHLDVKPRLFEEREGGEGALEKKKERKSRPQQQVVGGDQTLTLNLCALCWKKRIQRRGRRCDFMHVSVHGRAVNLSVFDAVCVL